MNAVVRRWLDTSRNTFTYIHSDRVEGSEASIGTDPESDPNMALS
jgi:hypothetical protein